MDGADQLGPADERLGISSRRPGGRVRIAVGEMAIATGDLEQFHGGFVVEVQQFVLVHVAQQFVQIHSLPVLSRCTLFFYDALRVFAGVLTVCRQRAIIQNSH